MSSERLRAVFLSAVVLLSVTLGTAAFAGSTVVADDPELDIDADPGEAGVDNDFTFTYDASEVGDDTEVQEIVVDFDDGSDVDASAIVEDDVTVDGDDTGNPDVDDTEEVASGELLIVMDDTFTLEGEDGDLTIEIDQVNVPNGGEFTGGVDFQDDSSTTIVDAEQTYEIEGSDFTVTITETNEPVDEGEDLDVTADIENVGEQSDTQTIELEDFDDDVVDTDESVSLGPGDQKTTTLTWTTAAGDAGTDDISVTSDDDTDTEAVTIEGIGDDLTIDADPGEAGVDNDFTFTYDASEVGDDTEVQEIVVDFDDGSDVDASAIVEDDVSIDGDDTGNPGVDSTQEETDGELQITVSDTFELGNEDGSIEITIDEVEVPNEGEFTGGVDFRDGSSTTIVDAEQTYEIGDPDPPEFDVTIEETNDPVEEGEDLDVTADIENVGEQSDTQTIELEDFDDDVVDSRSVSLDGGDDETITLTWATSAGDSDTDDISVASEDDDDTTEVTVESDDTDSGGGGGGSPSLDPAEFDVTITETNEPIEEGQSLVTTVEIENTGDRSDTQTIELENFDDDVVDSQSVSLDGGDDEMIMLNWDTSIGDSDTDDISVASEDSQVDTEVTIEDGGHLTIDADPGEAGVDNDFTFTYDASEVGDDTEVQEIVVDFDEETGVDVEAIEEDDVTVDGDDTGNPSVDDTDAERDGELRIVMADTFELGNEDGDIDVAIEAVDVPDGGEFTGGVDFQDDAEQTIVDAEQTYEIDGPADFVVTITETNEPVEAGAEFEVTADVENTDDEGDTQAIELEGFDDDVVDSQSVSLDGGDEETTTLTWATSTDDAGTDDVSVTSDTDEARSTLTIEELPEEPQFRIVSFSTDDRPIEQDGTVTAEVTVENTGDLQGTQDVELDTTVTVRDEDGDTDVDAVFETYEFGVVIDNPDGEADDEDLDSGSTAE